jgi:hypothetical protein
MRKMKTKLILILCVMVLATVVIVAPVVADGPTANISGNPEDFISIYETGNTDGWVFIQDYLNVNTTSCTLNVTSNHIGWTVGVEDASGSAQPGFMREWTTSWGSKYLLTAMDIGGVTNTSHYAASIVTLNGGRQVVWTGDNSATGIGTFGAIPITIHQWVAQADQHLTTGVYRVVVTFTAALP